MPVDIIPARNGYVHNAFFENFFTSGLTRIMATTIGAPAITVATEIRLEFLK